MVVFNKSLYNLFIYWGIAVLEGLANALGNLSYNLFNIRNDISLKGVDTFCVAVDNNFPFDYLYDETQEIAKAYDAACTPDFSVFDSKLSCIYRGQIDGSRPGNDIKNDGQDMRKVLNYLLDNKKLDFEQLPSIGCNIKWKN